MTKAEHLQAIGLAVLHTELEEAARTVLPQFENDAKELLRELSEQLDSPFEDVQESPELLALIQDWLDAP